MNLDVQYEKKYFIAKKKPRKKDNRWYVQYGKIFCQKKQKRQQMAMVPIYYTCSFIVSLKIQLTIFKMAHAP